MATPMAEKNKSFVNVTINPEIDLYNPTKIKNFRKRHNLTRVELSQLTGISINALQLWELGQAFFKRFSEGCNNKIKVLKRNAYGYRSFERFRKRIYVRRLIKQNRTVEFNCSVPYLDFYLLYSNI